MRASLFALLAAISTVAFAGIDPPIQVLPEPDSFALLAVAGVAAVVIAIRNRRK